MTTNPTEAGFAAPDMAAPVAAVRPSTQTVHGITLHDDYAWLRDPNYPEVNDPAVLAHLEAENRYFEAALAPHAEHVETLFAELKARIREDDASVPVRDNGYFYQSRFATGAQYRQWFRWPAGQGYDAPSTSHELLVDEPALAAGHDYFRLGSFEVSDDNKLLGYATDTDGGERFVLRFRDIASGELLADEITNTSGGVIFCEGDLSVIYVELSEEWRPFRVKLHRLGTAVADDVVLYEEADESFFVGVSGSQSDEYLFIGAGDHVTSEVRVVPLAAPQTPAMLVSPRRAGHEYDVDHAVGRFFIRTNDTHENFRLVMAPETDPGEANWQELVAPSDAQYLLGHVSFKNLIALHERVQGLDQIRLLRFDADDQIHEHRIALPEIACDPGLGTNPDYEVAELRIGYSSMVTPHTVYDYLLPVEFRGNASVSHLSDEVVATAANGLLITRKVQEIPSGYDKSKYRTERIMAPARDGALVPVTLVYPADFPRDGSRPLHLYAYGAYGSGMTPSFSSARLSLLDRGYAYAIAHVRGGDELGYGWYTAGKLTQRENTFNDFVDVAQHLIQENYSGIGKISISGGSAGGELMGAVLNQAPTLWAAAVAHVPFVDVLNTMLDGSLPLTPIEWPEWGNPGADADVFRFIRSYSPYDQVEGLPYPPLMVTAGLNDPRVTYWEPAKWVAKLRRLSTSNAPIIFKTNMGAGHGGKSGRFDSLRELAEEYAFLLAVQKLPMTTETR